LEFNSANGLPFAINPHPYFAYRSDTSYKAWDSRFLPFPA
jgi:hypothetical protein